MASRNWTERIFEERPGAIRINCRNCKVEMFIPPSQLGQKSTCTKNCADEARLRNGRVGAWASRIFEHREGTVSKDCKTCGLSMALPPSKLDREYCSKPCQMQMRESVRRSRTKPCQTCGVAISSSRESQKYCSQACNVAAREALNTDEAKRRAREGWLSALADGRIRIPRGEEKVNWKGGPREYRKRRQESGAEAAQLRAYRKNNPDKVREFSGRRSDRKRSTGRLPRGTVANIMQMQKGKCAICRVNVRRKFHLDHIIPLAIGGRHEPRNLQILCASCNVRKGAKDPIEYMQSLGGLL